MHVPLARFLLSGAILAGLVGCTSDAPPQDSARTGSPNTTAPTTEELGAADTTPSERLLGQTLYVPAYSHIYVRDQDRTMNLTTTLSVRNTSLERSIVLTRVDYYDSSGEFVRSYLSEPRRLGALASQAFIVDLTDIRGGVGANFIVRWRSNDPVSPPVVETVMVTGESTQGISLLTSARVLSQERPESSESE